MGAAAQAIQESSWLPGLLDSLRAAAAEALPYAVCCLAERSGESGAATQQPSAGLSLPLHCV